MHISGTSFETQDPDAFVAQCADTMSDMGLSVTRDEAGISAEISGVTLWFSNVNGLVRVSLQSTEPDALASVRSGVQAQLAAFNPALGELAWEGAGKKGDLPQNFSFAHVESIETLSDDFLRMELHGNDLARFATGGMHLRILRQRDHTMTPAWPRISEKGTVKWPENNVQLIHRVYTARYIDHADHKITVDILRHDGGTTSEWAASVIAGEVIGLIGPGGGDTPEGGWVLLAGDETAQPAILRMLETLPPQTEGTAFLLAGAPGCEGQFDNKTRIDVQWLHRSRGDDLVATVKRVVPPTRDDSYLWFAASKSEARDIRAHFHEKLRQPRGRFTCAAYWV